MNDKMREAFEREFSKISNGTEKEIKALRSGEHYCESTGNRLNSAWIIWQAALTQQPAAKPVGYAQAYELERLAVPTVVHVGVLMGPKPEKGFVPIYTSPQPSAQVPEIPSTLFDGFAVYSALSDKAKARTSTDNVSDVLDAVVSILRDAAPSIAEKMGEE